MDKEIITILANLGGPVVVVAMFLWYLVQLNGKNQRAMERVMELLNKLAENQERHTRVLINVAKNHNLQGDAEDLIIK